MKRVSKNNSTQLASAIKGREEEGRVLFTILSLEKCRFPECQNPTLQCQSELEQSIQMSLWSPVEQLWSSVEIVWISKSLE